MQDAFFDLLRHQAARELQAVGNTTSILMPMRKQIREPTVHRDHPFRRRFGNGMQLKRRGTEDFGGGIVGPVHRHGFQVSRAGGALHQQSFSVMRQYFCSTAPVPPNHDFVPEFLVLFHRHFQHGGQAFVQYRQQSAAVCDDRLPVLLQLPLFQIVLKIHIALHLCV